MAGSLVGPAIVASGIRKKDRMAKRRGGPVGVCPDPLHAGSAVVSDGSRVGKSGARQAFKCSPQDGRSHYFSIAMGENRWSPPPACPHHPKGLVVRNGRYADSTANRRQRYRCYPDPGDRAGHHGFTPPLPRDHVHAGVDRCESCAEFRGTHRGDEAVSRQHSWSARLVAESLRDLARGATYAETSKRVRATTGRTRTRSGAKPGTDEGRNAWHIAADWVETFSPVLWSPVERKLQAQSAAAVAERDRLVQIGEPNPMPLTIVIDDQPVWAKARSEHGRKAGRPDWNVLVVAEIQWRKAGDTLVRDQRLRLIRALPSTDHLAWKLVFDELGYRPDYVVADGAGGQVNAIRDYFGADTTLIPSLFHVRSNVIEALFETPGTWTKLTATASRDLRPEFESHLAQLNRKNITTLTPADWTQWWDDLVALLVNIGAPVEKVLTRRKRSEAAVAAVLPLVTGLPQLPLSTGGIELAIRRKVEPILAGRAHAFANLERTNRLFDLVVCDDAGLFNRMPAVIKLLHADGKANGGWSTPQREVADPQPPTATRFSGRYSSLRDPMLINDVARFRGLT